MSDPIRLSLTTVNAPEIAPNSTRLAGCPNATVATRMSSGFRRALAAGTVPTLPCVAMSRFGLDGRCSGPCCAGVLVR
jgi:hypothetical protein